jgi:hypothetical protein
MEAFLSHMDVVVLLSAFRALPTATVERLSRTYEGPGQKYGDYRASDPEGPLKHRVKIVHTR